MSLPGLPRLNYRVKATSNALEFWWQAPLNDGGKAITGYNLWCSSIPYSTIIGSSTFYAKASSLTNSQDYVFQLAAINTVGTGAFTNYQIAQPGIISQTGVTNLTVASNNSSTATVSWSFSNGVNEATNKFFSITMYPSSPTATMSTFRVAAYANQRSALISGLSTNYYTFLVQPINDAGWYFPNVSTLKLIAQAPIPLRVSGLKVWIDGNDPLGTGTLPTNGATVSIWYDKSGASNNLTMTNSPTFATNTINGKGVVNFAGSEYGTTTALVPGTFITALDVFVVYQFTGTVSNYYVFDRSGNPPHNGLGTITVFNGSAYIADNAGFASYSPNQYNSGNITLLNYRITQASAATSNYTQFMNGTKQTASPSDPAGWAPFDSSPNFSVGAARTTCSFKGRYCELVAFNTYLNQTQRQLIEGYMAWKWGIQGNLPAGHPYQSVAPV